MKYLMPSDIIAVIAAVVATFSLLYTIMSEKTKRKPIIVFEYNEKSGWYLSNIGNGPALNILMALKDKEGPWQEFVIIPAMAVGSTFHISWIGNLDIPSLGAVYSDFENAYYTTKSFDDKNFIQTGKKMVIPKGARINRYWDMVSVDF